MKIAPTILQAASIPVPEAMDGELILLLLSGRQSTGGRSKIISLEGTLQAKWCLRTDEFKFILAREPDFYGTPARELYDLVQDPGETHNLVEERRDLAAQMEAELEAWIARQLRQSGRKEDPLREHGISMKAVMQTHW